MDSHEEDGNGDAQDGNGNAVSDTPATPAPSTAPVHSRVEEARRPTQAPPAKKQRLAPDDNRGGSRGDSLEGPSRTLAQLHPPEQWRLGVP